MAGSALIADGVLLAGGRSTRMGRDKALLPHPVSGRPLVAHQLDLLREATGRAPLLSVRAGADYPEIPATIPRVVDDGEHGPLAALHTALAASAAPFLIALAVDMPGVAVADLRQLLLAAALANTGAGVVAHGPDGPEPLLALYPRAPALAAATELLAADRRALRGLAAAGLRAGWLRPLARFAPSVLQNWNTPAQRDTHAS